jgi:copper chaperone
MEKHTFSIPNISCGHCTGAIKDELLELAGISNLEGDIDAKSVTVQWDQPAGLNQILDKLKEINYPAE